MFAGPFWIRLFVTLPVVIYADLFELVLQVWLRAVLIFVRTIIVRSTPRCSAAAVAGQIDSLDTAEAPQGLVGSAAR
jgi:hypothetical protein